MNRTLFAATLAVAGAGFLAGCHPATSRPAPRGNLATTAGRQDPAVFWNGATVYFLLTDRFLDGDSSNDRALGATSRACSARSGRGTSTASA
jgi:hypothetical protein